MDEIITTVGGELVDKSHVTLSMWMIENKIDNISISYSGSGDDGDYTMNSKNIPEHIIQIVYGLVDSIVSPNFNNSGSYGDACILIEDGKLKFKCSHSDVIETIEDTLYDDELLDTSML